MINNFSSIIQNLNIGTNYDLTKIRINFVKNPIHGFISDENKNPKIQVFPEGMDDPLPNNDLPESEKQWLNQPVNDTSFEPVEYEKNGVLDKKGMTIWVQGMLQAGVRSGNFKISDINEATIANLIDLYKKTVK